MKLKTKIIAGMGLIAVGATIAFAGPVCDINNANNPSACSAQVSNDPLSQNYNVPFMLYNVTPKKTYNCSIVVQGDHANQVKVLNLEAKSGASVTIDGSNKSFLVTNNASTGGVVTFTMHNGRGSAWKGESNNVYVICSQ